MRELKRKISNFFMSSPPLRVFLTFHQEKTLFELSRASQVNQKTKDRASAIRLLSMGRKVPEIAVDFKRSEKWVGETKRRWEEKGLVGLWDAPKTGRKRKWSTENIAEVEKKLETESRSYNSRQLCQFLLKERNVQLSERQLRRILKKRKVRILRKEKTDGRRTNTYRLNPASQWKHPSELDAIRMKRKKNLANEENEN